MSLPRRLALLAVMLCSTALGQDLQQLDQETQALYHRISQGIVRVQLPIVRSVIGIDPLFAWYSKLGPQLQQLNPGVAYQVELIPSTQPTPTLRTWRITIAPRPSGPVVPNITGLVLDTDGHAILPIYVSRQEVGDRPFPVLMGDGSMAQAKFIGSDRALHMTVVQIQRQDLKPLALGTAEPPEGSLAVSVPLDPSQVRLGIWTKWSSNWGIVVRIDGTAAGFSDSRSFRRAAMYEPAADDVIQHGHVLRAQLGVRISPIAPNDPLRQSDSVLGKTPALLVTAVTHDSPADRAGLQAGDMILTVAGQPMVDYASIASAMIHRSGPTELHILRDHQPQTITVDLPDPAATAQ